MITDYTIGTNKLSKTSYNNILKKYYKLTAQRYLKNKMIIMLIVKIPHEKDKKILIAKRFCL